MAKTKPQKIRKAPAITNALPARVEKQLQKDPVKFLVNLIRQQRSLFNKEISWWKSARAEALDIYYPKRILLTDLYKDIELDGVVRGVSKNRLLRVSNKPFKIINKSTRKEDVDKTNLLNKKWVRKFIKEAIRARYHGHSLVYFSEFIDGMIKDITLVPREHIVPELNAIYRDPFGDEYWDYTQPPFRSYAIGIDGEEYLGLYDAIAPLYIVKKHCWQNWDEFAEKFGIPIRYVKTASSDKKVLNEIEGWLQDMGAAAYGIFPQDTEMQILENKQSDAFQVFNELRKACNEEIEICLSGMKNLTQEGGTYGKQEALLKEQDEVTKDDLSFVADLINEELIPRLIQFGYPFTEDDLFVWDVSEKLALMQQLQIYLGVDSLGFELDGDEVSERLGITIKGRKPAPEPPPIPPPGKEKKEPPPPANALDKFMQMQAHINKLYFGINSDDNV